MSRWIGRVNLMASVQIVLENQNGHTDRRSRPEEWITSEPNDQLIYTKDEKGKFLY